MSKMTGYETYCLYLALKSHFTIDKYDFFKYNGKTKNVSKESFLSRKDRFQFEKLARKCDDVKTHMILGFIADRTWIGDMLDDDAFAGTLHHVKKLQSMSYVFKNELEKVDNIKDLFQMEDNGYPKFMNEYMRGDMSFETLIILDAFIQFIPKFDSKLGDDYLWSKFSFKARKFAPFLLQELDKKKFKQILKSKINDTIYLTQGDSCVTIQNNTTQHNAIRR
jgi:hypothetical protein